MWAKASSGGTNNFKPLLGSLAISGGLIVDDISGIGIGDDILIPFVIAGGVLGTTIQIMKATDAGKNDPHGDAGRAWDKAQDQIDKLLDDLSRAAGKTAKQIKKKIQRIKENAQRKKKGETHGTRGKGTK